MEHMAYIGTYTKKNSIGIYHIGFEDGKITLFSVKSEVNPSYVIISDNSLFTLREDVGGTAVSYYIQNDGHLLLTGEHDVCGDVPCHLCIDERYLYVSNYTSGTLSEFFLDDCMAITLPPRVIAHKRESVSVNPTHQIKPHVHFSCVTPWKDYLAVCDLGLDEVLFYPRTCSGITEPAEVVKVPTGSGPRHAAFGRGNVWYVVCEFSCELLVYNGYGDKAELLQRISTLRKNDKQGFCAALRLSSDGKLALVSVRGANTLALFDIMENGLVNEPRFYNAHGNWPRDAVFSPCGKYVLCACELDDCLTIFSLASGSLKYLDSFFIPTPTCICFK